MVTTQSKLLLVASKLLIPFKYSFHQQVKNKTLSPKWLEVFSLHLFERKSWELDVRVFDYNIAGRADFMGRYVTHYRLASQFYSEK